VTFRDLRTKSRQTPKQVAQKLNIKVGTYLKYEYSMRLPSGYILAQMPRVFQCSGDEVLKAYQYHKEVQLKRYGKTNP